MKGNRSHRAQVMYGTRMNKYKIPYNNLDFLSQISEDLNPGNSNSSLLHL